MVSISQGQFYQDSFNKFGDKDKATIASVAMNHGLDYVNHMPVGWNWKDSGPDKIRPKLEQHIKTKIYGDPVTASILMWLAVEIVGVIIGWVIERILDRLFPEKKD